MICSLSEIGKRWFLFPVVLRWSQKYVRLVLWLVLLLFLVLSLLTLNLLILANVLDIFSHIKIQFLCLLLQCKAITSTLIQAFFSPFFVHIYACPFIFRTIFQKIFDGSIFLNRENILKNLLF